MPQFSFDRDMKHGLKILRELAEGFGRPSYQEVRCFDTTENTGSQRQAELPTRIR